MWYNQFNYSEEGSSWTTPALATPSSSSYEPTVTTTSSSSQATAWTSSTSLTTSNANQDHQVNEVQPSLSSNAANINKDQEELEKVKLRPPPPLLAKGSPRLALANKRPELEVRKDLTLPTAPTAREDNVFQADENEEISKKKNSTGGTPSTSGSFKCLECSMVFNSDAQLRSHTRHAHKQDVDALLFCPVCKTAVLHGLENLKVHLYKSHGIGEVFRCEDCNFETSVKSNYVKHLGNFKQVMSKLDYWSLVIYFRYTFRSA